MTPSEKYTELVALTKLHLLQEYDLSDWKYADPQTFLFLKQYAQQSRPQNPVVSTPPNVKPVQQVMPPPSAPPVVKQIQPTPEPKQKEKPEQKNKPEVKEEKTISHLESKAYELQKPSEPTTQDFNDIKQFLREKNQTIVEQIPSDEEAKKISNNWKLSDKHPKVAIVTDESDATSNAFLTNMAKAIQTQLAPAVIISTIMLRDEKNIEKLLGSATLKLIIIAPSTLKLLPHLMKKFREESKKQFLGNIPLCVIAETKEFEKNPKLKIALWNHLKQLFSHAE